MRNLRSLSAAFLAALAMAAPCARAAIDIPLYHKTVHAKDGWIEVYWYLYVKVGEGGTAKPYMFDTGSGPFMVSYAADASPQWWGSFQPTERSGTYMYESGSGFKWQAVMAKVTLSDEDGSDLVSTSEPVAVGQADRAAGHGRLARHFADSMRRGVGPIRGLLFGNFGAGIYHPRGPKPGLYSVLGQLVRPGGDKIRGFLVHTGRVTAPENPHITLYFDSDFAANPDLLADFPHATNARQPENPDRFPLTGYEVAMEGSLRVEAFRVGDVTINARTPYNGIIDTGAESLCIPRDPALGNRVHERLIRPDQRFALVVPASKGGTFELGFRTGRAYSVNRVFTATNPEARSFNFGLDLLNFYDVYYDLAGTEANGHKPRLLFRPLE